jgi:hypothetical protein
MTVALDDVLCEYQPGLTLPQSFIRTQRFSSETWSGCFDSTGFLPDLKPRSQCGRLPDVHARPGRNYPGAR